MEAFVFSSALRYHLGLRRLLPWLALGIVITILGVVWTRFSPDASAVDRYVAVSSMLIYKVSALAAVILATTIVSQEVEQKTIVYLLTRPIPRWKLLLFRYFAASVAVAVIGIILAAMLATAVFGSPMANPIFLRDCAGLTVGAFAYTALFLTVTLLINRAMILCLIIAFGWESIAPTMPGNMFRLSIYSYLQAIAQHPKQESLIPVEGGISSLAPTTGYLAMLGLIVALIAFACYWFTTFEYVPREDAE
jgi:ABC-2 type transport system permease protein